MRFSSSMFDRYKKQLSAIETYPELENFIDGIDIPGKFLKYAREVDNIVPAPGEWEESKAYMMPQLRALVGRYSKLGDNAFYRMYLDIDEVVKAAM